MIYLIGSLRNQQVPILATALRAEGFEVFDDWYAAGPRADDHWQEYENARGHTIGEALRGHAAQHVFNFDRKFLEQCNAAVLMLPAGKSGHLELGWALGQGKRGYVLFDQDPERYDVMYNFANGVFTTLGSLLVALHKEVVK